MNRVIWLIVLCLAAFVCLSTAEFFDSEAEDLENHIREVRKTKHSDKHSQNALPQEEVAVEGEAEVGGEYRTDGGYTVVGILKTGTKPSLVDSVLTAIRNATGSTSTTESTVDPETNKIITENREVRNIENTETTNAENTITSSLTEADVTTTSTPTSNKTENSGTTQLEKVPTSKSIVSTTTKSVIPVELNTSVLTPLVERVSNISFCNNSADASAIADMCEESKRELVGMFNKVIGQLSSLFTSMYEKMSDIAKHEQEI